MVENLFCDKDKPEYEKVWNNKEIFPLLSKDKENINKKLVDIGFKKIVCFDQISDNWEQWNETEKLTLAVLPIANCIDQRGTQTKEHLKAKGFTVKEKYFCVDLETKEITKHFGVVKYFPTRNIVVVMVNPFLDNDMYGYVMDCLHNINPQFTTQEEIWDIKLREQWRVKIEQSTDKIDGEIKNLQANIEDYGRRYMDDTTAILLKEAEKRNIDNIKKDITRHIKDELEAIKKLPMIKELKIQDKIYVSFGNIHITGGVKVGTTKKDGIDIPKIEPRKVEIGELKFIIGDGVVSVKNSRAVGGYNHPHATNDNICFGKADLEMKSYLASMQISKLIKLLYSWAFSYNEADAMTKLQVFYDEREQEKKKKE